MGVPRPELSIRVFPLEAVPVAGSPPLCLTDRISSIYRPEGGEREAGQPALYLPTVEHGGVVSGQAETWYQSGQVENLRGLAYWSLSDPVTGQAMQGFTLQPWLVPWAAMGEGFQNSAIAPTWWILPVKARRGDFWAHVAPQDEESRYGAIAWTCGAGPGTKYTVPGLIGTEERELTAVEDDPKRWDAGACYILSTNGQPERQGFAVKLWLSAGAPETVPWIRICWGKRRYSLLLQQGLGPVLSYAPGKSTRENDEEESWWRASAVGRDTAGDWFGSEEPLWVMVVPIGGRVVVRLWRRGLVCDLVHTERRQDDQNNVEPVKAPWPAGPIEVCGAWAPVTMRFYEVVWGTPEKEKVTWTDGKRRETRERWRVRAEGSFQRRFHAWRRTTTPEAYGMGDCDQASCKVTAERIGPGECRYTARVYGKNVPIELVPEVDGDRPTVMRGCTTPFVHTIVVRYGTASTKRTLAALEIAPAVRRAQESVEDPMLSPGPDWRLTVNREVLPDCELETGQRIGDNWPLYVQRYHPVIVEVRRGQVSGGYSPWVRRLDGYVWRRDVAMHGAPAGREMSVELRDQSLRLMRPAGVVDGRFPPLDAILAEKFRRMAKGSMPKLYGAEVVRMILECALGPKVAAALEYYYPEASVDWQLLENDIGWVSLLTWRWVVEGAGAGGLLFPPPWGRGVLDWIRQVADVDLGIFFFSGSLAGRPGIVPVYGHYFSVVKAAPTHVIEPSDYDADTLLLDADVSQVSEHDFNRVLVWGRFPGGDNSYRDIMPAIGLISAEARIETGSAIPEQNIAATWERTQILEGTEYWLPRVAQVVAHTALLLLRNVEVARYTLRMRGQPTLWWGHRVQIQQPPAGGDRWVSTLSGRTFRVMRVRNDYDLERGLWTAMVSVVPSPGGA